MTSQAYGAPGLDIVTGSHARLPRSPANFRAKAAELWSQGLDTVEIAQKLNARHGCMLTEADVANEIARWRDAGGVRL